MRVYIGHGCDIGRVRSFNQDAIGIDIESGLFVVADGMGGHAGGEIASRVVIASIKEYITSSPYSYRERTNGLIEGIQEANTQIFQIASTDIEKRGMGSTVTALLIGWGKYFIAHVGDSRAYLIRGGEITQITRDHSFVQQLVDSGIINSNEARNHERRNEITRAVGIAPDIEIDTYEGGFRETDSILLCSDGLWGVLSDKEVLNTVVNSKDPQDACDRLIELANNNGGPDNISAILVQSFPTLRKALPRRKKLKLKRHTPPALKGVAIGTGAGVLITLLILIFLRLIIPPHPREIWVKFKTKPETLAVTKAGKDTLLTNNDSLRVGFGDKLVFHKKGFYSLPLIITDLKEKEYTIELRQKVASVSFKVVPPQANISILDDQKNLIRKVTGESTVRLPFGDYELSFKHSEYEHLDTTLKISDTEPINLLVELKPKPLPLPVATSPKTIKEGKCWVGIVGFTRGGEFNTQISGSYIYIDDKPTGQQVPSTKPGIRIPLSPGQHTIVLKKGGKVIGKPYPLNSSKSPDVTLRPEDFGL